MISCRAVSLETDKRSATSRTVKSPIATTSTAAYRACRSSHSHISVQVRASHSSPR